MKSITTIFILAALGLSALQADAVAIVSLNNGDSSASNSDLLQTSLSGSSYVGDAFNSFNDESSTYNGVALDKAGYGTAGISDTIAPATSSAAVTVTFNLDLAASATGYVIDSITLFNGWSDGGRDRINGYSVAYSLVGNASFTDIVTGEDTGNWAANYGSSVIADDGSASLASGVDAIQVTFLMGSLEAGFGGISEIDVAGSAVPEPSVALLGALGGLALLRRRR